MRAGDGERYSRQVLYWGEEVQGRIQDSTVLVAGLGGLGATVSQLLVRGGVGTLHLVDDGTLALSDLQRQTLYGECDLGRPKVEVAAERLRRINSQLRIESHRYRIEAGFALPEGVDGVADCLDNFASRFQLFRALPAGTLLVHGGVQGDQGQVLTLVKGRSRSLEEICSGCRQPEATIPVTPDSALIVAGFQVRELFLALGGSPGLLDRFLVIDLANLNLSLLEV